MDKQKKLIKKKNWDYLIILDACRYDYFEKHYSNYLTGNLKKAISPSYWTGGWITKTFRNSKFHDTIYISSTPHVNSSGFHPMIDLDISKVFDKIIDVWDWGWDKKLRNVLAEKMVEVTLNKISEENSKRYIIHFNQPHAPYINEDFPTSDISQSHSKNDEEHDDNRKIYDFPIFSNVLSFLRRRMGVILEAKKLFGLPSKRQVEYIYRRKGVEGVRSCYVNNLKYVLENVEDLLSEIDGETIITADHGEYLGEEGKFLHSKDIGYEKILFEVPWFEVKN